MLNKPKNYQPQTLVYPYEFDYKNVRPLHALALTSGGNGTYLT